MKWLRLLSVIVASAYLCAGCSRPSQGIQTSAIQKPVAPPDIAWFNGSVEQAVDVAARNNKLLLIYWGAKWCPYCQALRKTVFTRPDFIAKTSLFIPVYLDADLPGAQAWGEVFRVSGYPTVLILKPDRTEIARMSGGMDLSQYAALLDDALQDQRPIQDVLDKVGSSEDCHRLSFYGWDSTALPATDATKLAASLAGAAAHCQGEDQTRLQIEALNFALQANVEHARLIDRVHGLYDLLDSWHAVRPAIDLIAALDDSLFNIVTQQGAGFAEKFEDRWVARMQEAADDTRFGDADRLLFLASALDAAKALAPDHGIPIFMRHGARLRVQQALEMDRDRFKRNDLVNAAGIVYDELGDWDTARALYLRELPNTRAPYYYMSHLATLAEKRGRPQEALDWMAKAYGASEGPATRLRWGSAYIRGLIRLRPNDTRRIRTAALQVAAEVSQTDAGHGRARAALGQINKALDQWATTQERRSIAAEVKAHFPPDTV